MNAFEKWQVFLGIFHVMVSFGALLGAGYICLKQNEINRNLLEMKNTSPWVEGYLRSGGSSEIKK